MVCAACGADNPEGARFCSQCGQATVARNDERRIVTVLFADLVGFTSLSERRDPESVKYLVDRVFQKLVGDLTEFGGVVDKILGDAILALFGAPTAHEDDPERAVRAALHMQRSLPDHAADIADDLQLRIGVNTGEVLVGQLRAGGDWTAMGDVVNLASRLQTRAEPGEVLVGPATHEATAGTIEYEARGPAAVKGRDAPIEVHAAIGAHRPPGYRPRRLTAPLVGRAPEFSMLTNAVEASVNHRRAHVAVLRGEAGIGKTRLATEVARWAEAVHGAQLFRGRCLPYGEVNVWWPIAELVRQGCGITSDDPPEAAGAAVSRVIADSFPELDEAEQERIVHGLRYLLFLDSPLQHIDQSRAVAELTRSVIALTERAAQNQPLMVRIADIHWARPEVLELLDEMADRLSRSPFVLMATGRADDQPWTPRSGRHNVIIINLEPLDRESASDLLDESLGADADPALRDDILDRSGGNPFFLEELVSLVSAGDQPADRGAGPIELPGTLRGIVAARLDALDPTQLAVVEGAATWGASGSIDVLERMAEALGQNVDVLPTVESLVDEEIFGLDLDRWQFRSDSVREVAYGRLTKTERHKRHEGIASYLAALYPDPPTAPDGVLDLIARHYGLAADLADEYGDGSTETAAQALPWLAEAAQRASQRDFHSMAAELHGHVLRLLDPGELLSRVDHLIARATALLELWEVDEAGALVEEADALAERVGDPSVAARVAALRGDLQLRRGDFEQAEISYRRSMDGFLALGDRTGYADARRRLGMHRMFGQDLEAAEHHITEALAAYEEVGHQRGQAWALQNLAWIAFISGRAREAERWARASADLFSELGDSGGFAWATGLLAFVLFHLGDSAQALRLGRRILNDAQERGDQWGEGMMRVLLASIALFSHGDARAAVDHAQHAIRRFGSTTDSDASAQAAGTLGRAQLAMGEVSAAFETLDPSRVARGLPTDMIVTCRLAAAAHVGDPGLVSELVDVETADQLDPASLGDRDRLVAIGLLLAQSGRVDEAQRTLRHALDATDDDSGPYAMSAAALCAAAAGDRESCRRFAGTVAEEVRSTYLDRTVAQLALMLAAAAAGEAAEVAERFELALAEVDDVEDRPAQALVRLLGGKALTAVGSDRGPVVSDDAETRLTWLGIGMPGWEAVAAAALGPVAQPG